MKYASEHAGLLTSVHQWKPIPPDRFASLIHFYTAASCDLHGHEAISHTTVALDRDATATVYYRRNEREGSVSSPVLMTMEGSAGKTLCFETTNAAFSCEPKSASDTIRDAMAYRQAWQAARLEAVAKAAKPLLDKPGSDGRSYPGVVAIAPRKEDFETMRRAVERAGGNGENLRTFLPSELANLAGPTGGIWLHNAGQIGAVILNEAMHRIASAAEGQGWMGMTGDTPMGWASPEGLPNDRV